jgi:hypothetical protein
MGGQRHASAALPPGKTRYPLNRRLGGPQRWFGRVRKISPPPGFDPRTVQPVASSYIDSAIPAHANAHYTLFNRDLSLSLSLYRYIYIYIYIYI